MVYHVLAEEKYPTSAWSGGTTTELLIFPEACRYADRDFDFRISSASIDIETSEFTSLPDYQRILMVLEGETTLKHDDEGEMREAKLSPFHQDTFSGRIKTASFGKCRDFNLMYRPNYQGSMAAVSDYSADLTEDEYCFIYAVEDLDCELLWKNGRRESLQLNEGMSLFIQQEMVLLTIKPTKNKTAAVVCRLTQ